MLLDKITSPKDIKNLNIEEMKQVASEIREGILFRDSMIGGHVGPNLGVVETTIALHYVFESPKDKIIFDVSHQCYPHKMLTGRKEGFFDEEGMRKISGYTKPEESEHDQFIIGHTSTSISLACGLAKARDLKGEKHNVIALIGDGSISGGEALEGFSNAAVLNSNIIIIVNDNEMSIAENHGGLYTNLRLLRETNGKAECNMFKALGFEYHYVSDGNSIEDMIDVLQKVKNTNKPTVIHIHTLKGKGYSFAEENKEPWHWKMPFNVESGELKKIPQGESITDVTFNYLYNKINLDKKVAVITAGTPGVLGFTKDRREKLGDNFIDVGIAEEHAVAMASALAKGGCKPVFMVMSSFIQRTYDQLSQDLALNKNPAVILVHAGTISGMDATHLGCFDIPLISNIPNIIHLAPTTKEEYLAMLDWAVEQNEYPVVIRMPLQVVSENEMNETDYSNINKAKIIEKGSDVAIFALGSFRELGQSVAETLKAKGIRPTLINPRYISGLDEELLKQLMDEHKLIVTLENGQLNGGYGEKIASFYGKYPVKVLNYGANKEFVDRVPLDELLRRYRLTPELITEDILSNL